MNATAASHPWSSDALIAKASFYVERMEEHPLDDWRCAFWSALALELLCRAALANISPVLLAGDHKLQNLLYALGRQPTAKRFTPHSISAKEVVARLSELVPEFPDHSGFCNQHFERRNAELHTGDLAFTALGTGDWLPRFHAACEVLLKSLGKDLSDLIADPAGAQSLIASLKDAAGKAVQQDLNAHAKVWENKTDADKQTASVQAAAWATRQAGHRVTCPACANPALLQGTPSGPVATELIDDEVVQRQAVIPSAFECVACGLHIAGLSKLTAAGLGNSYTSKSAYTVAEFFDLHTEDELEEARRESRYEEDFNEY